MTVPAQICSQITLRPEDDADLPFLTDLYAGTRTLELQQVPWSEGQKRAFLEQQFEAQHQYYRQQFPQARYDVVEQNGVAIGRLYVDHRSDEIRLIDIALIPEHRSRGIGTGLIREVLEQAGAESKPVRIHVEQNNPALRLYQRLGFRQIDSNGIYYLMEWTHGG